MPLPPGITNERRQDCIDHENRIDDIAQELHKHGGWWKIIGGGLVGACTLLGWLGNGIMVKLDTIETLLSADKVAIAELKKDVSRIDAEIDGIKRRHEFADQNGLTQKVK